ncbi:PRP3-domain-containing protein [Periconia macrospinosa]|uniref:PRP3-domain-containing protein n=1 Tax=Periconia macrospinosa TaxID=97972 RepID=A0A2V1D320_9PLEO|nr:PRP3-domain-containing protein [Periconia macrospinosa]
MVEKRPHPGDHGDPNKRSKPDPIALARAKAAEITARAKAAQMAKANGNGAPSSPAPAAAPTLSKLEAFKARLANISAAKGIGSGGPVTSADPSRPTAPDGKPTRPDAKAEEKPETKSEPVKEVVNPYFDPSSAGTSRDTKPRDLQFNSRGKYLEQGSKLRAQRRLEQVKKTLALKARRAGLDENSEKGYLIQPPPDIEWWDEGLLDDKSYEGLDNPAKLKLAGEDSVVTIYIQHPPYLKAPQDQLLHIAKPMHLTPKEQAKLRRMRRAEELKEHQAKIRLGLEPPPPPKVKRGNMMRVMGEQAIADPTAVEQLVEAQIQERLDKHLATNEERKLTKEQRHTKLQEQQQKDAQKGLYMCVFKIDTLAFGKHRYKVDNNAKQLALTGITIFNPNLNMVIVEGGVHSVNKYKKLMLQRVKWSENAPPTETQAEKQMNDPPWLRSVDADGNPKDLSYNTCKLVFEGEVKQRSFRKWGAKRCETDGEAREFLSRSKLDSLWALAKSSSGI